MKELLSHVNGVTKFQIQYCDSEEGAWTVPVLLTEKRINSFLDDLSTTKVKLIFRTGETEIIKF